MLFVNYKKKSREETCMFSHGTTTAHTTPRLSLTSGTRTKTTIYETSINPWRMACTSFFQGVSIAPGATAAMTVLTPVAAMTETSES